MTHLFATPKGTISIRFAIPEDAAALLELRLESLSNQPEAFAADFEMTAADGPKAFEKLITEYAKNHSGAVCIACAEPELIGMAGITRGHWPKTKHFGTLWGVYIKPAWRGYHIGGAVLDALSQWAGDHEMTVIYLGVTVNAQSAIRCYQRSGFKEYGIEPQAIFYNGIYYDQLLMVRLLEPGSMSHPIS